MYKILSYFTFLVSFPPIIFSETGESSFISEHGDDKNFVTTKRPAKVKGQKETQ